MNHNLKRNIIFIILLALFVPVCQLCAYADSGEKNAKILEYKVKSAFIYNFMKFIEWPEEEKTKITTEKKEPKPIKIIVLGKDPFKGTINDLKNKTICDRKIQIIRYNGFQQLVEKEEQNKIKEGEILFICSSEKKYLPKIISVVSKTPVLTIGEMDSFLEKGGIINFVLDKGKVRFEVNISAAKRAKLDIRSKLLRLAKNVYKEKEDDKNKETSNLKELKELIRISPDK